MIWILFPQFTFSYFVLSGSISDCFRITNNCTYLLNSENLPFIFQSDLQNMSKCTNIVIAVITHWPVLALHYIAEGLFSPQYETIYPHTRLGWTSIEFHKADYWAGTEHELLVLCNWARKSPKMEQIYFDGLHNTVKPLFMWSCLHLPCPFFTGFMCTK